MAAAISVSDLAFVPDQPAGEVDRRLRAAVVTLDQAEHVAVTWFAELNRRRLYRDLGYPTMRQYAMGALGFSSSRAGDFTRLAARLDELPRLRESVASGELGYTKAREIVKVASPRTEAQWLEEATTSTRQELEKKVRSVRERAKRKKVDAAQVELLPVDATERAAAAEVPRTISLRMTAAEHAQYEALWQRLGATPNAADLLAALAALADERTTRKATDGHDDACAEVAPGGQRRRCRSMSTSAPTAVRSRPTGTRSRRMRPSACNATRPSPCLATATRPPSRRGCAARCWRATGTGARHPVVITGASWRSIMWCRGRAVAPMIPPIW